MTQLEELLQQCTVKLTLPGRMGWGTGFFVAPELILTCTHVVQEAKGQPIQVRWQSQENWAQAVVQRSSPDPYDLALLRVTLPTDTNPPCVYLDEEIRSRDPLYLFGYPDQDYPNGCPVTFSCEGLTGDEPSLIKFASGQVRPGMSGSPLLNQRTGKVCGMVKFTRDRSLDLGGGAVSTSTILSQFPDLHSKNLQFHQQDATWSRLLPKPVLPNQYKQGDYKKRQFLLNNVRNTWVKGVLDNSLYSKAQIQLGLEKRFDVLELAYETPEISRQPLAKGTKVSEQFDNLGEGGTLLILGAPGSGKTTTLLELTRDRIIQAEQDVNLPIPVVFNLSSWTKPKQKIQNWLVRELRTKYQVSRILGKTWIQERELLLLLDGLDEVREDLRGACIQAINHFRQEFGGTEIVVCSRLEDYKNLQDRLQFHAAIILQPLTYEQVAAYLNRTGAKLAGVKMAWETDSVMQELAQTPLMLSVMALAYEGISAQELPHMNLEERRTHLWDKYIDRMFERRRGERIYPKESAIAWLSFLAQRMAQESQTLFAIEAIQPSWLQYRRQRWLYSLSVGFAAIVIAELGFGFTIGLAAGAIAPEMTTTLLSVLIVSLVAGVGQSIKPFEPLGWLWSWQRAWKPACTILAGGLALSLLVVFLGEWFRWTMEDFSTILTFGSVASLMTALTGGFLSGFVSAGIDCKLLPNQGIWRSAINSAYFALTGFAFISILLIALSPEALEPRLPFAAPLTLVCLYGGGLAGLQHILLRGILWLRGDAPWNYAKFLKYAETLLLIQHVGGQYKFVHNLLQNHLETHPPRGTKKTSNPKIFIKFGILSIITLGLCIGVLPFTIDTWRVNSSLAEVLSPRLEQNDRLMIKKNISGFNPLHRGDIIGFQHTDEMIKQGFKRRSVNQIVGLPSEIVEIKGGQIHINNRQQNEPLSLSLKPSLSCQFGSKAIPPKSYLVLINNPNYHSKYYICGLIPSEKITGRVAFRYWPINRFGKIPW